MANINITHHHNRENLGTVATLGVLICMVATIVGIKLWWFKHRLSFEQTSTPNGAAGGSSPPVIVSRRKKQQKYKKDKRYSQQIYDSVEVHGVFRQKSEDDFEIKRPQLLPPVGIHRMSNSTSSLILPPPRTKRSDQVHSTAFEDLELDTRPLTTVSSTDLTAIHESNTKISLTFEEFEKQFKLNEIKSKVSETYSLKEVTEMPLPPLRLNRSSSALIKTEKTPRYLTSSQSIAIPESHKVIEKRQTDFSRPTEDLTKIDNYNKTKMFESFGERRPTGYIKYDEVDGDLQEQYEQELNESAEADYHSRKQNSSLESSKECDALKALRNELIAFDKDFNKSPAIQHPENNNFRIQSSIWKDLNGVEYKAEDLIDYTKHKTAEIKEISSVKLEEVDTEETLNAEEVLNKRYTSFREQKPTEVAKESVTDKEHKANEEFSKEVKPDVRISSNESIKKTESDIKASIPVVKQTPTEFIKNSPTTAEIVSEFISEKDQRPDEFCNYFYNFEEDNVNKILSVNNQKHIKCVTSPQNIREDYFTESRLLDEHQKPTEFISDTQVPDKFVNEYNSMQEHQSEDIEKEAILHTSANDNSNIFEPFSFQENFESQINDWPQFVEKIETPKVNVRKLNSQDLKTQNSFEEADDFFNTDNKKKSANLEITNETQEKLSLNQGKPTDNAKYCLKDPDFIEPEEHQEVAYSQKKYYNQVRSLMTTEASLDTEHREVAFDSLIIPNSHNENYNNSAFKQMRSTGLVKNDEQFVTFKEEYDEDNKESLSLSQRSTSIVDKKEWQPRKVYFEDISFSTCAEGETEKFSLNQRRPTGFVRSPNNKEICKDNDWQEDAKDFTKPVVKFDHLTDFKNEPYSYNSDIQQRRPTGYIKNLEILALSDEESDNKNSYIKQRLQSDFEREISLDDEKPKKYDLENKKQQQYNTVNFGETERSLSDSESNHESLTKQKRHTGVIPKEKTEKVEKQVKFQINFEENNENQISKDVLKQRRPTGFIRKEDVAHLEKQVNFQLDFEEMDTVFTENEALKQRRPTGFARSEEMTTKQVSFQLNQSSDVVEKIEFGNDRLRLRRPTGFVRKKELKFLEHPPPIYQPPTEDSNEDFDNNLWREMEKDVEQDFPHNYEEEFIKIRHSYEMNEADFLELKDELHNPPSKKTLQPIGFGKTIEDDWENFEKLKTESTANSPLQTPENSKIIIIDPDFTATTSILREQKPREEDIQAKPRKSKVTFDFQTNEHVVPARTYNDIEYVSDYDDDNCNDQPIPTLPPQPMQRLSNINYKTELTLTPIVSIPTKISLFGSQVSHEDDGTDSWSAVLKHRHMTVELQNIAKESKLSSPPPDFYTPPPKPSYRNPMAQLAVQRAKEARADMDGFKSRSINDKKPETLKRHKRKLLNLSNDDNVGTDA